MGSWHISSTPPSLNSCHQSKTPQLGSQYLLTRGVKGEACPSSLPRIGQWHWTGNRNLLRKMIGRTVLSESENITLSIKLE